LDAASGDPSELARLQVSLAEGNATVAELETRCTELSAATETTRTELAESKQRLEDALVQVVAGEERHANCGSHAKELQEQIDTERRTIGELQNASIETDKAYTAWRVELEEKISTLTQGSETKLEELNVKLQLAETRAEETSAELGIARGQIANSEKTHEESVNRITVLTSELEQTRITVVTYQSKIQDLEGRVSELETSILEQETSHQEHVRRLEAEAKASLKEWVGKLEKANGKILEAETRQAAMKEAAEAAKALTERDLKALRAQWDAAQARISELQSAKAASEKQLKAAEEELAALQVKIRELEDLKRSQETTITELCGQLENLQASSSSRITELEVELQSVRAQAEDLQKSLNSTQEELGAQHAALLERIPSLESAAARATVLEGVLAERQAELDRSKLQLDEAAQSRDKLEQDLAVATADAEAKLAKAAEEASKLQVEFIEVNSTINTLRVELESAAQDAEFRITEEQSKASVAAEEAEEKLGELRTQLDESVAQLRKELEERHAALEEEKARCEATEKRVTEAEEAVVSTRLGLEAENDALQCRFDEQVKQLGDLQAKYQETSTALLTVSEESLQRQAKVKVLEEQLTRLAEGPQIADLLAELAEAKSSRASGR
jgi:chromosome segregation ATPase